MNDRIFEYPFVKSPHSGSGGGRGRGVGWWRSTQHQKKHDPDRVEMSFFFFF